MLSYNIKTILKTLNKLNGMIQLHGILLQWNFIIHPLYLLTIMEFYNTPTPR